MKKIYGFLGAVALMVMASCSSESVFEEGSAGAQQTPENKKGDLFMTMNIAHKQETRTATPNQGYEVGKDYENAVSGALIIFAKKNGENYEVFATSGQIASSDIVGDPTSAGSSHEGDYTHTGSYKTSFTLDRQTILNDLKDNGTDATEGDKAKPGLSDATKKITYSIFVVANPTSAMVSAAQAAAEATVAAQKNVQQVFAKANNDKQYWEKREFLMSSADVVEKEIFDCEIALGTHTTKPEAYNLGKVYIQRAMSRFDLATNGNHLVFEGAGNNETEGPSTLQDIRVEFDAVAMVNMAKSAYLFKVMAEHTTDLAGNTLPIAFGNERSSTYENYWVFSPDQNNSYFNPLFEDLSFDATGNENKGKYTGTANGFGSFFETGKDFTLISSLSEEDNTFEHEGHSSSAQGSYRIWRYCMENTNPDQAANQKNANSTGVIFRAKLSGTKVPTTGSAPIYAYNNVILGTADELKTFATNPRAEDETTGVYEAVRNIYAAAIQDALDKNKNESEGDWTIDDGYKSQTDNDWYESKAEDYEESGNIDLHYGSLAALDAFLVSQGFNIYKPTMVGEGEQTPVYYCYYLYWNRHNDNTQNTIMGIMEFATVRNNVYKLSVNKVLRLGHPGQPEDDPDTPDPDDPDEEDEFWLEVECEILPWEVRINNIEF